MSRKDIKLCGKGEFGMNNNNNNNNKRHNFLQTATISLFATVSLV